MCRDRQKFREIISDGFKFINQEVKSSAKNEGE